MASSVDNVYAGRPPVIGTLLWAPVGTPMPTAADELLDPKFVDLGYVGENGYELGGKRNKQEKRAFGGDVVKVLQTEYGEQWKFTLIEFLNPEVLKVAFGPANVTVTPATATNGQRIHVKSTGDVLPRSSWVVDSYDGDARVRFTGELGQPTEVSTVKVTHSDISGYEVTIDFYKNKDGIYTEIFTTDGHPVT